jgi:hypothetical protein|tara:strand:- start:197 stop:376 length:180 start_codon:yes stop_codon:yes gene_type:complete
MKEIIEKQILEWQQEIIKQNSYIMRLEGGIQAYQLLLQKMNEEEEKTGTIELGVKNVKK